MRIVLLGGCLILAGGVLGAAPAPGDRPAKAAVRDADLVGRKPSLDASARREQIVSKLNNLKITLEFTDTPLPDALDFIRSFSGIDFVIDVKVRERFADDPIKISLKVKDIPLKSALKLMLGSKNLGAVYRDGVLLIVLKEDIDKEVYLKIYDVRDLLLKIQDHPGPIIELKNPGQTSGIAGATFTLEDDQKVLTEDFIVDIIRKNCGGTTWDENANASITLNNGLLMVVQSRRVHAEVQRMIGLLRQYK
jgi:hypothetical protein